MVDLPAPDRPVNQTIAGRYRQRLQRNRRCAMQRELD
jgi:hypothetical protein